MLLEYLIKLSLTYLDRSISFLQLMFLFKEELKTKT